MKTYTVKLPTRSNVKYWIIKIILLLLIGTEQLVLANQDPLVLSQFIIRQAEKENKLIFLYVGSDVCLESRSFLSEIVNDKEYYQFIKNNFIVSILDYDKNPSLALRYSLPTIPGFLIIDSIGNTFFGTTRPQKQAVLPILQLIVDKFTNDRNGLLEDLQQFKDETSFSLPNTVQDIIDSTMNVPNHISLDLGRYILSLSPENEHFQDYVAQFLEWIKSENFDYVEGSFFMPRGFSTYHGESKYSFFNFKLQEMLLDFYSKTNNPKFKYAFLKSMKYLKRDLFIDERVSYSTGYASKKYFKMNLKQRLQYYPPSPRRSDLALSQIVYLKIMYKVSILLSKKRLFEEEVSFLSDHLNRRLSLFSQIVEKYKRDDGLMYFTSQKYFTNFETQVEFFALLQLMEKTENVNPGIFLRKMENLYKSFVKAFFDREVKMFSDIPLESFTMNKDLYQYKLYFTREHARLLLFLDFLYDKTKKPVYKKQKVTLINSINKQNEKFPERFYWLNWYQNLANKQ